MEIKPDTKDGGITILVVDDEREIADLVEIHLRNEGYSVVKLYDGAEALSVIDGGGVKLALLDVMLPGVGGVKLCEKIRERHNIPIIMLTAKSGDEDKIDGLRAGADDYVTKPFNPDVLIARVKAQLRRFINLNKSEGADCGIIDIDGLIIDRNEHVVSVYGERKDLTPMEFDILSLLAGEPGRVFSAEQIFERVWGEKYMESSGNTVMVHIRHIREKIGDGGKDPRFIKTVWGVGYKVER